MGGIWKVIPDGVKAWPCSSRLTTDGETKANLFTTGKCAEQAWAQHAGGYLTLAGARKERTKSRLLVQRETTPHNHWQFGREEDRPLRGDRDHAHNVRRVRTRSLDAARRKPPGVSGKQGAVDQQDPAQAPADARRSWVWNAPKNPPENTLSASAASPATSSAASLALPT